MPVSEQITEREEDRYGLYRNHRGDGRRSCRFKRKDGTGGSDKESIDGVLQRCFGRKKAVVVRSGIGKVNAAVCTQILIDDFHVEGVINTGIAGSLKNEINIGDIVLSTDVVHHDVDAKDFGYERGQVPRMEVFSFPANERMLSLGEKVCREVNPEIQVFRGRVTSGDQFISDKKVKDQITETFQGYCVEMEGSHCTDRMAEQSSIFNRQSDFR